MAVLVAVAAALFGAAPAAAAPSYPDAVVLVSGYNSSTAFTTPDPSCEGKEGDTWANPAGPAPALRAAGEQVFTAPVKHDTDPIVPPCAPGGAPAPGPSTYIDSYGDDDANGAALGAFLAFLRDSYGVERVQLVAHSDGGNWSRSALTGDDAFAGLDVRSLTTLGTPYTGSMIADLGTELRNGKCDFSNRIEQDICDSLLDVVELVYQQLGPTAVEQLTHSYLEGWNPGQRIGACPVTTIAGTGVDLPLVPFTFYNPSDGLVGLASAEAHEALALPSFLPIPAPDIPGLVTGGTYPVVHASSLSFINPANLLNTPAISAEVTSTVGATPDGPLCNGSAAEAAAGAAAGPVEHTAPFRLTEVASRSDVLGTASRDAVVVARPRVEVTCGGEELPLLPMFGDGRIRLGLVGRCKGKISATGPKARGAMPRALLLQSHPRDRLLVRQDGRRLEVGIEGGRLHGLRLRVRTGKTTRTLEVDRDGRAKLPRGDTGATVIARARTSPGARLAVASLVLSR